MDPDTEKALTIYRDMPITVPLHNASLLVDTASESLNNYNDNYVYEDTAETVASLQMNSCKVLREFTYTNIITGNGLFTFNVPEKIPGIFALQLLKCYIDVQPRLQELTETITANGRYPLSAFITELDETDGISKDSVINVDITGDAPVLESKSITINSNGSQNVLPSSGYDGLSSVSLSVNVPVPEIEIGKSQRISTNGIVNITPDNGYDALESVRVNVDVPNGTETKSITTNGTYTPTSPNIGFSSVSVNVPNGTEIKSITSNGTYTPTSPNIGFSSVTVNVPQEHLNIEPTKIVNISSNDTWMVSPSSSYDALSQVQVNVDVPNGTETKSITTNGTYTPTSPNIGFSSVTVNVPSPSIESLKTLSTLNSNGTYTFAPSSGYVAMERVKFQVSVPNETETKTITSNGTYTPSGSNIGFSSVSVDVPEKQLESRQVYYSTNGLFRLDPSTGYDGFTYANIEINVPTVSKSEFNKFRIYYYTGANSSESSKYVNPITMQTATSTSVSVTSGQSIMYITYSSTYNVYVLGFFNNNSGNTYDVSLQDGTTYYIISTAEFISAVSIYNDNTLVRSRFLEARKIVRSTPYMLGYEFNIRLDANLFTFNSS